MENQINRETTNTSMENMDKTHFHIKTGEYIFNAVKCVFENVIEIKFFIADEKKEDDICVKITIPKESYNIPGIGNVNTVYCIKEYPVNKTTFEKWDGTIHMLKTALRYVCDTYPYIEELEIQDETHVNNEKYGKPLITSRRLLLGEPGWYEEYFGAKPNRDTTRLIRQIAKNRNMIDDRIRKYKPDTIGNEWFTSANILSITNNVKPSIVNGAIFNISPKIFGTFWKISRNTIDEFVNEYTIEPGNTDEKTDTHYYKHYVNSQERHRYSNPPSPS